MNVAELQEEVENEQEDRTLIEQFEQFYQLNYQDEILQKGGSDEAALVVNFPELSMFDLSLAENLLENPDETIEAANLALETFDTTDSLNARFANLPSSSNLPIREARSRHLNQFHEFQGIIKQKNDVKPQLVAATFECPRCQTHQVIKQNEKKLKKPRKCGECGWKGSFNLIEKELQDVQKMVLEDAPEELTGGEQPKRINCFLKDDLVSPMSEKKTNPGSKVTVVGTLKEVPVNLSTGAKSTSYDLQIQGNYVEPLQEEFSDLEIDASERDEIISASKDPRVFDKLVESVAPSIYGHDKIKQALTLQLFGGVKKSRGEGVQQRGDIHVLLVGDPGAGKCLRGDSKVQMASGELKRLDNVEKGETVLTTGPNDDVKEQTVTATHERTVQKILKCETETGKTVELTPEHKLRQPNNTWRPAFTLSKNDHILCYDSELDETRYEEIVSIEEEQEETTVYDITVPDTHNFVANNVVVHNSQMLKRISHVAPKSRFVSGKGSTGAGLTASVVKDEFLKGWALEAGALVLANKGIACIDELDKMEEEDASAMHEALEQQSITISKANIQATLKAETTVLAAANPKYGRFDPYDVIAKQIDMPSTLINRFDLIFPIRDIPDQQKDRELSSFILDLHRDDQDEEPPYSTNFMKRYIAFARQRVAPTLTDEALEEIQDYFVSMRNQAGQEERIQSVPISARQLEGLVRLASASAKTRLSTTVDREDAERAVELLHYCLTQIGYDEETGKFDIDKIETGTTASERSQISIVKELITELEEKNGGSVPLEDLYQEAEAREIDEHDAEEIVEKLKRKGDIYEPTSGYISRIQ